MEGLLRVVAIMGLSVIASSCDHRQSLLGGEDPVPAGAPRVVLPADSVLTLRDGAAVRVGLPGNVDRRLVLRVGMLLMDSARVVQWRSSVVASDSGAAWVPVNDLPVELRERGPMLLTAQVEGSDGRRFYAGGDEGAVGSLREAKVSPARIRSGTVVPVGGVVRSLVGDPDGGRVYITREGSGEVGVVELPSLRVGGVIARDGSEIESLARAGHYLGYLADAGSRVVLLPLRGRGGASSLVLGPLEVEVKRVFAPSGKGGDTVPREEVITDRVRPYGTSLRLACADGAARCGRPVAVVASGTQSGAGVLRLVEPEGSRGPLVVPSFLRIAGGADTVPAGVTVRGPRRPDGVSELLESRAGVTGCLALRLGREGYAVTESGRLFAASGGSCGPGARLTRLDGAVGDAPSLGRLAVEIVAGEDRIGAPRQLADSPDGSRLLVRDEKGIWLLDEDLRVLGFRAAPAASQVSWVEGTEPGGDQRFVVAGSGRLGIYEADRFGLVEEVVTGPLTATPIAALTLLSGARVVAVVAASEPAAVVVIPLSGK